LTFLARAAKGAFEQRSLCESKLSAAAGVPITGILGDQQRPGWSSVFRPGEVKNTYGTGCFLLMNTGERPVPSNFCLLTHGRLQIWRRAAHYALEGSIAITGALVQWLRDNLGIIEKSQTSNCWRRTVNDKWWRLLRSGHFPDCTRHIGRKCARVIRG